VTVEADASAASPKRPTYSGKIKKLPVELRTEFERRLVEGRFSDYRGLSRWLNENGYYISPTSLHRHGKALEHRLEVLKLATSQARAVVEAAGAADDTVNEGLMRLVQGDLFRVLVELKEVDPQKVDLNALARNVASICRSSVQMRRAAEEMRNGIGKRVLAAERKVVAAARRGVRGGLSAAAEKRIRAALLEIAELPATSGGTPQPRPLAESAAANQENVKAADEATAIDEARSDAGSRGEAESRSDK
jgi:Bacteriophage Mu, Gp27